MTTVATWNLHHMGKEAKIPAEVVEVIERLRPDVLVLTEWVDQNRGKRAEFLERLKAAGYATVKQTDPAAGQNQVLVASVSPQQAGDRVAPDVDEAAHTNFLHVVLPDSGLHVVGSRVPHYQSEKPRDPEKLVRYWRQFTKIALEVAGGRVVFIGDFNVGGQAIDEPGRKALKTLVKAGYRMCAEEGGLDRALVSPSLKLKSFSVIEAAAGHRLTGQSGLSDHAMLMAEVS